MRAARVCAGVGFVAVAAVAVRLVLVFGYDLGAVGAVDISVFCAGVELMLCASFYATGRLDGMRFADAVHRRARRQPPPPVASVAPAAGRRDASLAAPVGSDAITQDLPRVEPGEPPPGQGPYTLCLAGPDAQRALKLGGVGCLWCPHARPTGEAAWKAWQGFGGHTGVCPCCRFRLVAP